VNTLLLLLLLLLLIRLTALGNLLIKN